MCSGMEKNGVERFKQEFIATDENQMQTDEKPVAFASGYYGEDFTMTGLGVRDNFGV
jgi:hypothetical protein